MRSTYPIICLVIASLLAASCAEDTVVTTGTIETNFDPNAPFETYQTFSVVTAAQVPDAPELGEDEQLFNDTVNEFIRQAMQNTPVCLSYIPPEDVEAGEEPDVFAGNGLAVTTEEGVVWQCVGGWWWGYWGWYWDWCKWIVPVPVEGDVGSMLIPVGPRPTDGEDPAPVFAGLARSLITPGPGYDEIAVRNAVNFIFQQWPDPRTCEPTQ